MKSTKDREFCRDLRKYLREYSEVTSFQGLRYIGEKRSLTEKIFWIIIVLLALAGCIYMICEIVWKFQNSPVVVSFATKETPIYEIPFPTVTICPETKCAKKKFNFTDVYQRYVLENKTISNKELQTFLDISLLCNEAEHEKITAAGGKTVNENFFSNIDMLKPDPLMICIFMEQGYNTDLTKKYCDEILTPIITDEGICYTFNILDRDAIFRKHVLHYSDFHLIRESAKDFDSDGVGYVEGAGVETYPRRALMSGADNSFSIIFFQNQNDTDFTCNKLFQGFRILLHKPSDIPQLSKNYFSVPLNKMVVAAVQPHLVTTSKAIQKFSPEKRNCFLQNERYLKHFKIYSQNNCMLECLANYTLDRCGCVSFHMPRDNATPVCGSGSTSCMTRASNYLKIDELQSKISNKIVFTKTCDCKPLCTDLQYNVETSHSDLYWREYLGTFFKEQGLEKSVDEYNDIRMSIVSIYLKSEQFMTLERNELYGVSDLISNFGGLLGLFTGFSLISAAEVLYFLTLRIYYNVKLYGSWSGLSH